MAIKKSDAVKFVYVNGNSLPSMVDDATIYIIGGTQELYVGRLKIAAKIDIDSTLSNTSTNPVENQAITKELNKKATIESPTFTGIPNASTAAAGTSTTQIATTAFVQSAVTAATVVVDDALNSTSTNPVQNKVIKAVLDAKANLDSPTFTGTPIAPTATKGTNTTQVATTSFIQNELVDYVKANSSVPIAYGVCTDAGDVVNKTITLTNADGWNLEVGSIIVVKHTNKNTALNPTFNVNNTGNIPIGYHSSDANSGWAVGEAGVTSVYVYNGTSYMWLTHSVDVNTTYTPATLGQGYATCTPPASGTAMTATLSKYELVVGGIVSVKFSTNNVPASATLNINSNTAKAVYWKGVAIPANTILAGDTATFIYNGQYHLIAIDRWGNEATSSNNGLMSAADKAKLDTIESGANKTIVDDTISSTSTNPVQNRVVKQAISDAIAASDAMVFKGTLGTGGTITSLPTTYSVGWTYRVITPGTYAGNVCEEGDLIIALISRSGNGNANTDWTVAQTNIDGAITNITGTSPISVTGSGTGRTIAHADSGVTASSKGDTTNKTPAFGGTFKALSATVDAKGHLTALADHTVKIPNTEATTSTSGLMSATDKTKLDGVAEGANAYTHPSYTSRTGKPTANQTPAFGGTVTVSQITSDASGHVTSATDRTITIPNAVATTSTSGLMSATDKTKLDGITPGASVTGVKGSAENTYRTGDVNLTSANVGALALTGGSITNGSTTAYVDNIHAGVKLEEDDNGLINNVHPSNARFYATLNGSNTLTSVFEHNNYTDGFVGAAMMARNYIQSQDKMSSYYGIRVQVDKTGACKYIVRGAFKNAIGIAYGTCDTAAATAAKVVTVDGLGYDLTSGAIIGVKFTNTNTANNPTLNVNNTGAKSIWYDTALITTSNQKFAGEANRISFFMYDGTQWVWIGHGVNDASGYLPLTGGTVSGATTVQDLLTLHREGATADDLPAGIKFSVKDTDIGTTYNKAYLYAYQDHRATTSARVNVVLNSGGNAIIGSGEAADSHYTALKDETTGLLPTSENIYLTSDNLINIQANANTIENRKGIQITGAGALVPVVADIATDDVQSIGTSTYKWNAMYATTFYGTLSGNASSATEFNDTTTVAVTGDATGTSAASKKGWSIPLTLANSGVTAGSYGPSANATPATGATFNVPYITVDAKGRLTAASTKTVTMPSDSTKANLASPTFTGTPKAPTAAAGTNTTQIATTAFVNTAVGDAIAASDAMIFKGTLGTGGTVTALPTTYKTGWTYRVITAGTYAGNTCEVGDLIIALVDRSGSGNVNADWTVAQTNIDGAITSISGTSPITVSGSGDSRTIALANSGVTAGSYGPSADASPAFGETFDIPYITVDAKGRTTAASTKTITLPAAPTTITGNAGSATKLATGRAIDGVTFDGSAAIVHYGTCGTAAGTAAKVVSCTSFTLVTGSTIRVKFTVTNTAASPTLNVNSTGAKNIFYKGAAITAGYLIKDHVYEFVYDGTQYCLVGEIYSATTTSIGSASAGTAIAADDITAWSAGTLPTLGTAIPADDITAWSAGTAASASVSNGVLTITNGTVPSLTYTAKSIPNVTAVGTLPSLTYTERSIPNISVTSKTVVTGI